jgi:hypothetical protein
MSSYSFFRQYISFGHQFGHLRAKKSVESGNDKLVDRNIRLVMQAAAILSGIDEYGFPNGGPRIPLDQLHLHEGSDPKETGEHGQRKGPKTKSVSRNEQVDGNKGQTGGPDSGHKCSSGIPIDNPGVPMLCLF